MISVLKTSVKATTHNFTLGNELRGIKLGNYAFQNFIPNGRQDSLIIVHAEALIDSGQVLNVRPGQDPQRYGNHLQVFRTGCCRYILKKVLAVDKRSHRTGTRSWLDATVVEDGTLEPRNQKMGTLPCGLCLESAEAHQCAS